MSGLQLLDQFGLSIIGRLKSLFGDLPNNLFLR
jgi:hypothetical protein